MSAAEWKNAPTALAKLDANGDGQITPDELRPPGGPPGRPPAEDDMVKTLMAFDKNGDGKLSKAELPERMQGMLARGDKDGDGFLTTAELQAMAPPRQQEGEDHGPRGGRPGGGMMRMDPVLAAIDADHDGTISAAELKNAVAALKPLDKDNDGQLSGEEIRPAFGGRGPGRGERKEHD
ncbi:MAG: EF-hand domain-containing protein [Acidobacteria bacterium]|nr:EF-hand domain-containing protein [Acidobacteriota bacterium]